jgi:hypothetical protein
MDRIRKLWTLVDLHMGGENKRSRRAVSVP